MRKQTHTLTVSIIATLMVSPMLGQEALSTKPARDFKIDESGELKIFSDFTINDGEIKTGNIRVIGGKLTVAGTVTGKITVIGGNVEIQSTALVEGTIVALGGAITKDPMARITGEVLEVNTGTISLSRKKTDEIFDREHDDDDEHEELASRWYEDDDYSYKYDFDIERKIEFADDDDDDNYDDDEWSPRSAERYRSHGSWRNKYSFRRRVLSDFGVPDEAQFRYNRAEGAALYIPFSPDTDDIRGFHIQSIVGYASGPQTFYGRLAIGQYLFNHRLGFIAEGHSEPRNDDGWRLAPEENFLGALLIHEDWYDWYETEGYGGSVVAYPFSFLSLGAKYRNEVHRFMPRTVNWSVFGDDKNFRPGYDITVGDDVSMEYHARIGDPIGLFHRRFKASFGGSLISSMSGSDFHYTKQEATAELFVPFQRRLGFRFAGRTGALLSTAEGTELGYQEQHLTPIGGIGTISGYDYKDQVGSHYAVINVDFSLKGHGDILALLWQYGTVWNAEDDLFTGDYFDAIQQEGRQSVGLRLGGDDTRIEIFRPLTGGSRDYTVHLRIMDF